MTQLFFSKSRLVRQPKGIDSVPPELARRALQCIESLGVTDGIPFVLDDHGRYESALNRFFRACPTMGVRSTNSLRAYAFDILTWLRFLSERRGGKSLWCADRDDIAAFHASRRRSAPPYRIEASSWNRMVAALQKLYDWAVEEGLIAVSPFGRDLGVRRVYGMRFAPLRVVQAREPAARCGNLRYLDLEHYLLFRDVGLRGSRADGAQDPTWRGRHGERNALFAELLVTTGLRLEEATSLLALEMPRGSRNGEGSAQRSVSFRVPAAVGKGHKSREIRLSHRWLRQLADYIDLERLNITHHPKSARADIEMDERIVILEHDRERILIAEESGRSTWIRLDRLSPLERQRLVMGSEDGVPAALWLNESGHPVTPAAWEAVFRRASARCRALGIDLEVHPHTLRHTFATNMLAMLIRVQIGSVVRGQAGEAAGAAAYRRLIGDPLQKLQRLMGHASLTSTYIYLDSLEESRELVEAAADQWMSTIDAEPEQPV